MIGLVERYVVAVHSDFLGIQTDKSFRRQGLMYLNQIPESVASHLYYYSLFPINGTDKFISDFVN